MSPPSRNGSRRDPRVHQRLTPLHQQLTPLHQDTLLANFVCPAQLGADGVEPVVEVLGHVDEGHLRHRGRHPHSPAPLQLLFVHPVEGDNRRRSYALAREREGGKDGGRDRGRGRETARDRDRDRVRGRERNTIRHRDRDRDRDRDRASGQHVRTLSCASLCCTRAQ
eukprot:1256578-Rhodomonas_salina.3